MAIEQQKIIYGAVDAESQKELPATLGGGYGRKAAVGLLLFSVGVVAGRVSVKGGAAAPMALNTKTFAVKKDEILTFKDNTVAGVVTLGNGKHAVTITGPATAMIKTVTTKVATPATGPLVAQATKAQEAAFEAFKEQQKKEDAAADKAKEDDDHFRDLGGW